MAKKASGTSLILTEFLMNLPEDQYKSLTVDQIYELVLADKAVAAAMKKMSLTESTIRQKIGTIKKDRGFAKARAKKKATKKTIEQPTLFVGAESTSDAPESSVIASDVGEALTLGDALEIIQRASGKFPQLSDAIKVAALHRAKLAEQQRQLDGLFGG